MISMRVRALLSLVLMVFVLLAGCGKSEKTESNISAVTSDTEACEKQSSVTATESSSRAEVPKEQSSVTASNGSSNTETSKEQSSATATESSAQNSVSVSTYPSADNDVSESEPVSSQQTASEGDPTKKGIFARRNVLVNHFYDTKAQSSIAYCLVLPRNYDSSKSYPVLLYLHGVGVGGSDGERHVSLLSIMQREAPDYLDNAVLIAPQCPSDKSWNIYEEGSGYNGTLATVKRLLDAIAKQYSCDENRYYAVGYSFGGYGVLTMADYYNDLFAAVQVVAGWYDTASAYRFVNLPIWFHHGTADNVVSCENSKSLYNAILKLGSQNVKISLYEGIAHDSYSSAFRDMTTYTWLFSQTK